MREAWAGNERGAGEAWAGNGRGMRGAWAPPRRCAIPLVTAKTALPTVGVGA